MKNRTNNYSNENNNINDLTEQDDTYGDVDNHLEDLRNAFDETIISSEEIFKNLIRSIKSTVKNEALGIEFTKNVDNIYQEFKKNLGEIQLEDYLQNLEEEE
ncbi:hypothetical protein OAJ17_03200 [Acidimicrobiaceae bacterium]|nr:hypothetical protein [Acidimicrobiaceae bacterium]